MDEFKAEFDYNDIQYNFWISPLQRESLPTVFQVRNDRKYFCGHLVYYKPSDRWAFFENNGPDNAPLAQILANFVQLWYQ